MDVSAKNTKSGNLMIPPKRRMRMKTGQELGGKGSHENDPGESQKKSRVSATQRRFNGASLTAETVAQSQV